MRSFFCGDEAQVQSPVCFNNLLNGPSEPGHEGRIENVFSNSTHGGKEEQTMAWTLSSLGHSRRLHGRSNEIAALRQAYRSLWEPKSDSKPTVHLALISGAAGVGKTALALCTRQLVVEDGGFFLTGKFDQMHSADLYSPFVSAFTELVENVIERGPQAVQAMRSAIQSAVHTERRILTDMIPALEKILGPQKRELTKQFGQNSDEVSCFKFVFRMFVRAISSPEFPIIFLLDDLHYADKASLDLLQALVSDTSNDGILFIATCRQEKTPNEYIRDFLQTTNPLTRSEIMLENLSSNAVDEMVAEIFSIVHPSQIKPLTQIIYRQTGGNVFYIREFLRYLQEEGLLTFDEMSMEWVWDERKIQKKIDFRKAIQLSTVRVSKLPKPTREVLEVAACLGTKIDEKLINRISPRPVFAELQNAASRGFLLYDDTNDNYRFTHDLIQEAVYKLISPQQREAFHLTIGRELWRSYDDIEELERHIFVILGQIRDGADLITYQEEKNDVAALCLRAGELAICSSSFQKASEYLLLGVSMLGDSRWEEEYDLSLELYNAAAEVEYCIGNFGNVEKLASQIFENTRWFPDTLRAHSIHVYSLGSRGHMLKAVERGLEVLASLGEKFPKKRATNSIAVAIKKIKVMIRGKSNDALFRMPLMDDPEKIAAMQMMNIMFLYAYVAVPALAPLIAVRMVKLTLEYGLCDLSSVGFVTFAMLLCGSGNDIEEGIRCGELAMMIYNKFENSKARLSRVSTWFYGSVCVWKKPIRSIFDPLRIAHRTALETGDIDFAMLNSNIYCWESFDICSLPKVEKIISGFSNRMEVYGQDSVLMMVKPLWQMVHNFMGKARENPKVLTGKIMEQEYTIQYARENNKTLLVWLHFYQLVLAYMFGDYKSAEVHASACRVAQSNPFGSSDCVLLVFYDGLVALANQKKSHSQKHQVAKRCIKVFKTWAKECPENFLGKLYFLEAELAAATGDHQKAHAKYTSAISLSREGGYIMQHALANERAGKYFLAHGDTELARSYLKESLTIYRKWGGRTKFTHLKQELPSLLAGVEA